MLWIRMNADVNVDLFHFRCDFESAPCKQAAKGTWEIIARPPSSNRLYTYIVEAVTRIMSENMEKILSYLN